MLHSNTYYTIPQAAKLLNVSRQALYRSVKKKYIATVKIEGQLAITKEELERHRDERLSRTPAISSDKQKRDWYSVSEAVKLLHFSYSKNRIYALAKEKKIPSKKIPRTPNGDGAGLLVYLPAIQAHYDSIHK